MSTRICHQTIVLISMAIICLTVERTNLYVIAHRQQQEESIYHPAKEATYCDSDHCDSIVNKCMLTNRCLCEWKKNARCSKDCIDCLEEKFGKCCGCVGLCPRLDHLSHSSHVGHLAKNESDQALFELLTDTTDIHRRWVSIRLEQGHKVHHPETGNEIEFAYRSMGKKRVDISHDESFDKMTCIVAFINRQLSMTKCKSYCVSMGAFSFRWFYEGCCECIGKYCVNYGIEQPRCLID